MTSLSELLEWKYPETEGISTKQTDDGSFKITKWPLGDIPSSEDISTWMTEYEQVKAPELEKIASLEEHESLDILSRKIEEIIDFIENGKTLSGEVRLWASNRKTIRSE